VTRILGSDGSDWLRDFQEDETMSYDHKPRNPNKGGVSRSGFTSESRMADTHSRLDWSDWLLIAAIGAGLLCAVFGITIWADVPMGGAR
jgi:hypothetical protein